MPDHPKHPSLLVLGYSESAMLLASPSAPRITAVISIHGAREHAVDVPTASHRLTLRFDDTEFIDWTDPTRAEAAWARHKWSKEMGRPLMPPTINDARAIIDFAHSVAAIDGTILCQCQAGISRSPAASLLCLAA